MAYGAFLRPPEVMEIGKKKYIYIYIYSTYNTLSNVLKLVTRAFQYACVC